MRRKGTIWIATFVGFTLVMLGVTFANDWKPFLGLDLQGGISVVMQPNGEASEEQLDDSITIIRSRIDSIGVAEPEITRQGTNIVVDIPGVKNQDEAKGLIAQTGELRFRPVLAVLPPDAPTVDPNAPVDPNASTTTTVVDPNAPTTTVDPNAPTTTVDPAATTVAPAVVESTTTTTAGAGNEQGLAPAAPLVVGENASAAQETTPSTVTDLPATDPTVAPTASDPTATDPTATGTVDPTTGLPLTADGQLDTSQLTEEQMAQLTAQAQASSQPTTAPEDDLADQTVVLPQYDPETGEQVARYQLGPAALTGAGLTGATAVISQTGEWTVNPAFKGGAEGIDAFNALAAECFAKAATCPTGQGAITLDAAVLSAPTIQTPSFEADAVQISGDFSEKEAKRLTTVLRYGALPIQLEVVSAQAVSATLGKDALHAGLVAGIVGLLLVAAYMIAFYRLLGVSAVLKLLLEGALLWVIISGLGTNQGLAITLAGITGIVVSIGVSVDSNVVFYEHVKEDIRNGRTPRSAADKSFASAWSTIVKADVASLIAASLLYFLAVGPVRGFAFYLGLSTILDLIASWMFMRPLGSAMLRTDLAQRRPRLFGLPDMTGRVAVPKNDRRREPETAEVGA